MLGYLVGEKDGAQQSDNEEYCEDNHSYCVLCLEITVCNYLVCYVYCLLLYHSGSVSVSSINRW